MKKLLATIMILGTWASLLMVLVDAPKWERRYDHHKAELAAAKRKADELTRKILEAQSLERESRLKIQALWKELPHECEWVYHSNTCDKPGCLVIHRPYYECSRCGKTKTAGNQLLYQHPGLILTPNNLEGRE